jgi:drug/metabolite transporter (DMT)-like permease
MRFGYLFMFGGLVAFSMMGVLHKLAEVYHCRPAMINVLLFAWSTLLVCGYVAFSPEVSGQVPLRVAAIALPAGFSAAIAILTFQSGIKYGKIATSWLIINLSTGLPTAASILVYHEKVNARKLVALACMLGSMLLLWKDKRDQERAAAMAAMEGVETCGSA